MYIYKLNKESENWEVGYYDPEDEFILESEYKFIYKERAIERVNILNGGKLPKNKKLLLD